MSGGMSQDMMKKVGIMGFPQSGSTPTPNGAPPQSPAGSAMNPMEGFRKAAPPAGGTPPPPSQGQAMGTPGYTPMQPYNNPVGGDDKKRAGGK